MESRFVLSASPFGFANNTNLCLNNFLYPTGPHSIIVYYMPSWDHDFSRALRVVNRNEHGSEGWKTSKSS